MDTDQNREASEGEAADQDVAVGEHGLLADIRRACQEPQRRSR